MRQSVISRLEEGGGARNRIDTLARVATALDRHLIVSFREGPRRPQERRSRRVTRQTRRSHLEAAMIAHERPAPGRRWPVGFSRATMERPRELHNDVLLFLLLCHSVQGFTGWY